MKRNTGRTLHLTAILLFTCCWFTDLNAQNIGIEQDGVCINCPDLISDPSAALEVRSNDRGILVPRLDSTAAISNPVKGLVVYDKADNYFKYYDGSEWQRMGLKHISFPVSGNTFIGIDAGDSNTTGILNTAIGRSALGNNTTGQENTALGQIALSANTIGHYNTATGRASLFSNTTGNSNTATGWGTLFSNTTGYGNTALGRIALYYNTTGINNTAIGPYSMYFNRTGVHNTAVGRNALYANTIDSYNTAIGSMAFGNDSTYSNSTALGYNAQPTASNRVRLGNSAVTQIGGYANWSNVSDASFKTQVQNNVPGLDFISRLNPVTYQMDMDAIAKHQHTPDSLRLFDSEREKAAIRYTGFLAQEVEQVAELVGYDFSGVDTPQHERDNYSLRYAEFVVPLVKAVQELEIENKQLRAEKDAEIADLKARLSKIEAMLEK